MPTKRTRTADMINKKETQGRTTTITDRLIIQIWRQDQEDVRSVEKKVTYDQNAQMSNVTTAKRGNISNINATMHSQKDGNRTNDTWQPWKIHMKILRRKMTQTNMLRHTER